MIRILRNSSGVNHNAYQTIISGLQKAGKNHTFLKIKNSNTFFTFNIYFLDIYVQYQESFLYENSNYAFKLKFKMY